MLQEPTRFMQPAPLQPSLPVSALHCTHTDTLRSSGQLTGACAGAAVLKQQVQSVMSTSFRGQQAASAAERHNQALLRQARLVSPPCM